MNSQRAIAIIEDEAPVRTALAVLLRALGFQATAYESAEAFIDGLAAAAAVDCILMDQNLPGRSGLALSEYLRARQVDIPQVMITARDEQLVRDKCRESGIPLLIKPVDAATLNRTINGVMTARPAH